MSHSSTVPQQYSAEHCHVSHTPWRSAQLICNVPQDSGFVEMARTRSAQLICDVPQDSGFVEMARTMSTL